MVFNNINLKQEQMTIGILTTMFAVIFFTVFVVAFIATFITLFSYSATKNDFAISLFTCVASLLIWVCLTASEHCIV